MSFWRKLFGKEQPKQAAKTASSVAITPQPSAPKTVPANVEVIKDLLRRISGARDFIQKAQAVGFRFVKEDQIGLILAKGECTLILCVLPSRGPDSIWCLSLFEKKGSPTVNLVDEGKLQF